MPGPDRRIPPTLTMIRRTEEQGATFVELFFDLVFVFAVTQVTATLAHDLTAAGLQRAVVVFWPDLVGGPGTWSLTSRPEHASIRLITLRTALASQLAVMVPLITSPLAGCFPLSLPWSCGRSASRCGGGSPSAIRTGHDRCGWGQSCRVLGLLAYHRRRLPSAGPPVLLL